MITKKEAINLILSEYKVKEAIKKARQNIKISNTNNIGKRHFDAQSHCILRGYIGEIGFVGWISKNNITCSGTNILIADENVNIYFQFKNKITPYISDYNKTVEYVIATEDIKRKQTIEFLEDDKDIYIWLFTLN